MGYTPPHLHLSITKKLLCSHRSQNRFFPPLGNAPGKIHSTADGGLLDLKRLFRALCENRRDPLTWDRARTYGEILDSRKESRPFISIIRGSKRKKSTEIPSWTPSSQSSVMSELGTRQSTWCQSRKTGFHSFSSSLSVRVQREPGLGLFSPE